MRLAALVVLSACVPPTGTQSLQSSQGLYTVDVTFTPDPPTAAQQTTATLELRDAATDEPVDSATIELLPFMPAHGHGIPEDVSVLQRTSGVYDADFEFSMPGSWELRLDLDAELGTDEAVVTVEVL